MRFSDHHPYYRTLEAKAEEAWDAYFESYRKRKSLIKRQQKALDKMNKLHSEAMSLCQSYMKQMNDYYYEHQQSSSRY